MDSKESQSNLHNENGGPPASVEKEHSPPTVESQKPSLPKPPDGGWQAWTQCASGFCVFFNTWGLLISFGAFQTYYETALLSSHSASQISWIGTVQSCFILIGALYSGPLYDWGYLRHLIGAGFFMLVFGMFMTSLCYEYWQVFLAQGLFVGLGLGFLFTPTVGVLATWFLKRRGLAMGIASSGSAIGGVVYPIVFYNLVSEVGFCWAIRVIAFIMLFLSIIPLLGMRMQMKPPAARKLFDAKAWAEPEYTLYVAALTVGYLGMYVPYFYIQLYCQEKAIVSNQLDIYLVPIMNAAGFFGRFFFGRLADKIGPMNAFITGTAANAILIFGWMGVESEAGALVFSLLYGFFSAGFIILPATVIAVSLCPDMRQYGMRVAMASFPSAIGLLVGNPIAGAILQRGWLGLQGFSAGTVIACAILASAARVAKVGWELKRRC